MKPGASLAGAAAQRLDGYRRLGSGPLAAAQEALRQAAIVECIRGPQPPSALALQLIERFNRMAAQNETIRESSP